MSTPERAALVILAAGVAAWALLMAGSIGVIGWAAWRGRKGRG